MKTKRIYTEPSIEIIYAAPVSLCSGSSFGSSATQSVSTSEAATLGSPVGFYPTIETITETDGTDFSTDGWVVSAKGYKGWDEY
jgi:hypothetical protein